MKNLSLLSIIFLLLTLAEITYARNIKVTKFSDSNDGACDADCSLREAVRRANILPGPDRILLGAGRYVLDLERRHTSNENKNDAEDLYITDDLTIKGVSSEATIIDGTHKSRLLENTAASSHLIGLTLMNGAQETYHGSAILNSGGLTLTQCVIKNNTGTRSVGSIANTGRLFIYSSIISNNISNNILISYANNNTGGGGLFNDKGGELTMRDSTIEQNTISNDFYSGSGGGLYNKGKADIRRSLFRQNNISIRGNGAAIMNVDGADLKIVSTTISDHISGSYWWAGGAVSNGSFDIPGGKMHLSQVTITNNNHFGLFSSGDTTISNSIIAGNVRYEDGLSQNCYIADGEFFSSGLLLGTGDNPNCYTDFLEINDDETFLTLLKPLADNGGPTLTHALRKNSLAVDTGVSSCPGFDQRGFAAPLDGDADGVIACDIGAVEYQPDVDLN